MIIIHNYQPYIHYFAMHMDIVLLIKYKQILLEIWPKLIKCVQLSNIYVKNMCMTKDIIYHVISKFVINLPT